MGSGATPSLSFGVTTALLWAARTLRGPGRVNTGATGARWNRQGHAPVCLPNNNAALPACPGVSGAAAPRHVRRSVVARRLPAWLSQHAVALELREHAFQLRHALSQRLAHLPECHRAYYAQLPAGTTCPSPGTDVQPPAAQSLGLRRLGHATRSSADSAECALPAASSALLTSSSACRCSASCCCTSASRLWASPAMGRTARWSDTAQIPLVLRSRPACLEAPGHKQLVATLFFRIFHLHIGPIF